MKTRFRKHMARPLRWLRAYRLRRAEELAWRRRAHLEIEELEDRTQPSTSPLSTGFDGLDLHWIAEQQRNSFRSDVYQCREECANLAALGADFKVDQANVATDSGPRHELILVDAAVPNLQELVAQIEEGLPPGAWYDLYVIDATSGGVEQITDILSKYHHNLDAVHLITHGAAGELQIGADRLDLDQLNGFAEELSEWKNALTSYGDLLLYGCDASAGAQGNAFVEQIHRLTGLDVAASSNDTGSSRLGGDWVLETHLGEIGTASLGVTSDAWSGLFNIYTVDNRNDSGAGSLRQAIIDANNNAGADSIVFDISGGGPRVIKLSSALPVITGAVTIDATTNPGFSGTPRIVLDGDGSIANGLELGAGSSGSEIRGFAINGFTGDAIRITAGSGNNLIAGNFLGSDATGLVEVGNGGWGIRLLNAGANNVIGGASAADRNVIVGNDLGGIALHGSSVTGTRVEGNLIGVGADGTTAIGNSGSGGVLVTNDSSGNTIGGMAAGMGNWIANNTVGIQVLTDATTRILGNTIFANAGLGIDLGGDGVTLNDPGDGDSGGNFLKNYPTLTAADTSGSAITIDGSLNSVATGDYHIEFFASSTGDPTGFGEGNRYLGFVDVTTDASGDAFFSVTLTAAVATGEFITATNTDLLRDVTSEFSANIVANGPPIITSNGGGASGAINVPENSTAVTTVTATDVAGDSLTYSIVGGADAAAFNINPVTGALTFVASRNFEAPTDNGGNNVYNVIVSVDDGNGGVDTQMLAVTVTNVNEAPVAVGESYTLNEDVPLVVPAPGVLGNDADPDGNSLSVVLVSGPANGSLSWNTNGSFTYTPNAHFNGADSFRYRASDGALASNIVTVALTIDAVDDAPVLALPAALTIPQDTPLVLSTATGNAISISDVDVGAGTLQVSLAGSNGTLTLASIAGLIFTVGDGTSDPSVQFTGTLAAINNALNGLIFDPTPSYFGGAGIGIDVSDLGNAGGGGPLSANGNVPINVMFVNHAPVAVSDAYATNEDTPLIVPALLGNDSDPDGDALSAILVSGPTHGVLFLNANGSFTYTPGANYNGADSFQYRASDGSLTSNIATVSLTIDPVNDAPVAVDDAYTLNEDGSLSVAIAAGLLANDSDIDSASFTAVLVSGPAHGSLFLYDDCSFIYNPVPNYNGPDSFTYRVTDGNLDSNVATVNLTINAVNDAPIAAPDTYTLSEDTPLTVNVAFGLLANDTDIDSATLSAVLVSGPINGVLALNANGSFTYTPNADYNGADSFTYQANDGNGGLSNVVSVTFTISAVNDAPVAIADAYTLNEDSPLAIAAGAGVLANDTDIDSATLTAILVSGPAHGSLILSANGSFTYTPDADYNGPDSFTYEASDGSLRSSVVTVTFTIDPDNDAPVAVDDAYTLDEDTPLTVGAAADVLTNDTDIDSATLTTVLVGGPIHGGLALNADGSFTYTPNADYNGTDSFTYQASDGSLLSNVVTVTFTINPVNDAPVAAADAYTLDEDAPLTVNAAAGVLANDVDIDSAPLSAILVSGPTNGTLTLNADGSFTYTPDADYNGADSFTYQVGDGSLLSNIVTVSFTINPVNDAPVAVADAYALDEDTPLVVDAATGVLANDSDIDSATFSVVLVNGPSHGTVFLNADGSFLYTPNANFNGADSFQYRTGDGSLLSNVVTVSFLVSAVNDAPVLVETEPTLEYPLYQGTALTIPTGNILDLVRDIDGDPLDVEVVDGPAHGVLTRNPDGSYTFTPDVRYVGADQVVVRVTDGNLTSATIVVHFDVVSGVPGPPPINDSTIVPGVSVLGPPSNSPLVSVGSGNAGDRAGGAQSFGVGGEEETRSIDAAPKVTTNAFRSTFVEIERIVPRPTLARADFDRAGDERWLHGLPTPNVSSSPSFQEELWRQQAVQLFQNLDTLAENVAQESFRQKEGILVVGAATVVLTSGYVLWYLRTFYLVLSALAARPIWRNFDPLAVLDRWEEEDDVERMFD